MYGKILRVSSADEKYISGEYKHISCGKAPMRDKEGNMHYLETNDPRIIKGEFTSIQKGIAIVKDNEGNTFSVSVEDERLKSGELVGTQKNTITVKDKKGNKFRVHKNDPRYLSGELVGISKGMSSPVKDKICYTNGIQNIFLSKLENPPDGFKQGMTIKRKDKKMKCVHCNGVYDIANFKRWHGDKCKRKSFTEITRFFD